MRRSSGAALARRHGELQAYKENKCRESMSAESQFGLPDGAVVCLRTITPLGVPLYMSTVGDSVATHGVGTYATLRPHRQDWEAFRVRLFDDGTAALQNAGGGYLSPENKDAKRWTFRAHCPAGGWERLTLTPTRRAHGEISNTYPSYFSITTRINGETLTLSRGDTATGSGADTEVVVTTTATGPAPRWAVRLAVQPVGGDSLRSSRRQLYGLWGSARPLCGTCPCAVRCRTH